jgi:hypothetical protein
MAVAELVASRPRADLEWLSECTEKGGLPPEAAIGPPRTGALFPYPHILSKATTINRTIPAITHHPKRFVFFTDLYTLRRNFKKSGKRLKRLPWMSLRSGVEEWGWREAAAYGFVSSRAIR